VNNRERACVVIPTYDERENLERVVAGVRAQDCDVLVVDDASPDGTGRLADQLAAADPGVSVLHRPRKLGLGSAYLAGFGRGLERGYQLFVEMDADGSHLPEHLVPIVEAARAGGGLAIGSRYSKGGGIRGWGAARYFLSWGANLYTRLLLWLPVRDCTSGYRCYTRRALEAIGLKGGTVKARLELSASQAEELLTTLREVLDERKDSEADVGEA